MRPLTATTALLLMALNAHGQNIDARERHFVRQGMHEGEVVYKIGKPDHEAFISNTKGKPEEKTWTYFPHPQDPQAITILTLKSGVVAGIERKVVR